MPAAELVVVAAGPAAVICGRREERVGAEARAAGSGIAAAKAAVDGDMVGLAVGRLVA